MCQSCLDLSGKAATPGAVHRDAGACGSELDWARNSGGRVAAWYSQGPPAHAGPAATQRRAVLADSHLTSPTNIQRWTTSFPVYRER
ncbi:hypothetical protein GTS_07070 [Gandjariella thermophila]|uniref:Uncharacterized protein n=1 Tax=Gandjariella thermophila TaxID=1931992 RepID=A0A4D4J118_9PSEU|nr:hypothetical protein GTS_07070 [Gandjariella thermophila]